MKASKVRIVGMFAAFFMLFGLLGATAPHTADAAKVPVGNVYNNNGKVYKKSKSSLVVSNCTPRLNYTGKCWATTIKPGKYIPRNAIYAHTLKGYEASHYGPKTRYVIKTKWTKFVRKGTWNVKRV